MSMATRLVIPILVIGAVLLTCLTWLSLVGFAAVVLLVASLALMAAWIWFEFDRRVARPVKAMLSHDSEMAGAAPEIDALGRRLSQLESQERQLQDAQNELKRTQEQTVRALQEHERLRAFDALWEWHASDDSMRFSQRWKAMLGYANDQFSDTRAAWINCLHPADAKTVDDAFRTFARAALPSFESEHRLLHRDRSPRWVLSRAHALRDESGRATRILGQDIDITAFKRMDSVSRHVSDATARSTGDAFFRELVQHLAAALGVRKVLLTRCQDEPPTRVRTLACWNGGRFENELEYDLAGTPCEEVVRQGVDRFHATALRASFPRDQALSEDSYFGVPVVSANGDVFGHLAILDDKPLDERIRHSGLLRMFARRAAAEMARSRLDRTIAKLVTELDMLPAQARLQQIVRHFAELIGVREAIVTRCARDPQARLHVLAWWRDGHFEPNTQYNLVGTTCEETINEGRICIYPDGVGVRFPLARPFERESYVGVPCFGAQNRVIGHLAGFHNKPLPEDVPEARTLQLFADRAAMELQHLTTVH